MNRGFADLRVEPLHHVAPSDGRTVALINRLAAPRGFEPRFTDPKSAVLPLDEGAAGGDLERARERPGSRPRAGERDGAEDGTRTRDPHLGKVMLYQLSHFRLKTPPPTSGGAESQDRTGDTAIFSRVLYQLSYLGPMANQARSPVGGGEDTTAFGGPSNLATSLGGRFPGPDHLLDRAAGGRILDQGSQASRARVRSLGRDDPMERLLPE